VKQIFEYEVIAKLLGARASRPQILEKCGRKPAFPAKPEGFAIGSYAVFVLMVCHAHRSFSLCLRNRLYDRHAVNIRGLHKV
jgi:hypothetical protein